MKGEGLRHQRWTSGQSDILETFSVGFFDKLAIHILDKKEKKKTELCMWRIKQF